MAESPWPRGAAFVPEGLTIHGRSAPSLAEEFGTPLVVVDEEHFRGRCRELRRAFGRVLWAVKAFPAPGLIRIAADEGLGLLAATGGEVATCLRAGVRGPQVVLHGNNKLDREIDLAVRERVGMVVLDNEEEVARLDDAAAEGGIRLPVVLRLAPAIDVAAHEHVATAGSDTKFGIPVSEGEAMRVLKSALDRPHLEVLGIHLHLGSQLLETAPYLAGVDVALDFLAEARDGLGFEARLLDAGGGMGIRYTDEEPVPPAALAGALRRRLAGGCAERGLPVPELMVEPGRAVSADAAVTLYRVGTVKESPGVPTHVSVDGGMSDNIRPALYGSRYTVAMASRAGDQAPRPVTVVGRHCESGDVLARDVPLPGDVRRGDLLAVAATGAYEYAMAGNYNRVGRLAVVLAAPHGVRTILRREDEGELARLEVAPDPSDEASPPGGVQVRAARPRDAREVVDLIAAVAAEGRFIRTDRMTATPHQYRRRFRGSWTAEGAEIVAVADGRVIGHLGTAREAGPLAHVASLGMSVERGWRDRGVGAALMAEAIRWARWAAVEKLTLSVFPHNTAALALYRRFGFAEEGRLRAHTRKRYGYEDEVVMARWV